jgi:hypothetical protein
MRSGLFSPAGNISDKLASTKIEFYCPPEPPLDIHFQEQGRRIAARSPGYATWSQFE